MKKLYLVLVLSWLAIAANGEELNCTFSVGETSSYAYSPQEMAKQKFSVSREIHSSREPDNIAEIFRGIEIPTNAGAVFVSAGLTTGLPQEEIFQNVVDGEIMKQQSRDDFHQVS